jgi:ribonuclease HI
LKNKNRIQQMLRVYTDGSSINNGRAGNRGGYAAVYPDFLNESFGCPLPDTSSQTNQTAELTAIYEGLKKLKDFVKIDEKIVRICTDSDYSIQCLTKWVVGWRKRDWKTAEGKPVVHRELIEKILNLLNEFGGHQFHHVKSHTGFADEDSRMNDIADRLARKAVDERKCIRYEELDIKVIHSNTESALPGIPLTLMGPPIEEDRLFEALLENIDSLDKKYLKSALLSAYKKTLADKSYELEKTKIYKSIAYRLIEKTHLTIEHVDE